VVVAEGHIPDGAAAGRPHVTASGGAAVVAVRLADVAAAENQAVDVAEGTRGEEGSRGGGVLAKGVEEV
jgi:hypothetical protein